jgi:DNA-binding IclR family transcriptional regulator
MTLLNAFSAAQPELSLNELARATGLPMSTAYRLVSELVDAGGLERREGSGYRIGLRLWEIGAAALGPRSLREVATPFMQDLYEATHENVHLAILDGHEALYIEKINGRRSVSAKTRQGGRLPLHATSVGKVLLAYAPPEFVEEVLAAGLRRYTPHTMVVAGQLQRTLAEVRRTGVAFAAEELTIGTLSVASPLRDADGTVVAAISIVVRSSGADLQRLAPAVRTAALCASRQLRRRPVPSAARHPALTVEGRSAAG